MHIGTPKVGEDPEIGKKGLSDCVLNKIYNIDISVPLNPTHVYIPPPKDAMTNGIKAANSLLKIENAEEVYSLMAANSDALTKLLELGIGKPNLMTIETSNKIPVPKSKKPS